jgi:hypothetical protein
MFTPEVFMDKWDSLRRPLIRYEKSILNEKNLPKEVIRFLSDIGMPSSVPPYLSFRALSKSDLSSEPIPMGFLLIGYTANGDYICISEKSEIIILDHEDNTIVSFMNSSIPQLLEFFLEYVDFIKNIQTVNGRKAFIENNAPPEMVAQLKKRFYEIDSAALQENSFWDEELDHYK